MGHWGIVSLGSSAPDIGFGERIRSVFSSVAMVAHKVLHFETKGLSSGKDTTCPPLIWSVRSKIAVSIRTSGAKDTFMFHQKWQGVFVYCVEPAGPLTRTAHTFLKDVFCWGFLDVLWNSSFVLFCAFPLKYGLGHEAIVFLPKARGKSLLG